MCIIRTALLQPPELERQKALSLIPPRLDSCLSQVSGQLPAASEGTGMPNPLVFCFPFLLPVPTALASSTEQRADEPSALPHAWAFGLVPFLF